MKKILSLFILSIFIFSLSSCEDRKITDDESIIVFYTNTFIRRQASGGIINEPTYATYIDIQRLNIGSVIEPVADPIRPGYTFGGWYDAIVNEDIFGDVPAEIARQWDWNTEVQSSTTLYARWIPNENSITYVIDEFTTNNPLNPSSYFTRQSPAVSFAPPSRPDSTFIGWFFVPQDQDFDPNLDNPLANTRECPVDENITESPFYCHTPLTLYAHFSLTRYRVQFSALLSSMTSLVNPQFMWINSFENLPTIPLPRTRTDRVEVLHYQDYTFLGYWDVTRMRQFVGEIPSIENPDADPIFLGDAYDLRRDSTLYGKWAQPTIPNEDVDGTDFVELPRYMNSIRSDFDSRSTRTRVEYRVNATWNSVIDFYNDYLGDNSFDEILILPVYNHLTVFRALDENGLPFEITVADLGDGVVGVTIVKTLS